MPAAQHQFDRLDSPANLHGRVTRSLGLRLIQAERAGTDIVFPNEADLCLQLGVSRSILREAIKVLADKGMIQVRPRSGTRSRPRSDWNLFDPDILCWQAEVKPDARFLREMCEIRLAIEPTAAGFAAVRASAEETEAIAAALQLRESLDTKSREALVDANLSFSDAVVVAAHNPMFRQLSASLRAPMRVALSYTVQLKASQTLESAANRELYEAIVRHDPRGARQAAEEIVGFAMLAVEQIIRKGLA